MHIAQADTNSAAPVASGAAVSAPAPPLAFTLQMPENHRIEIANTEALKISQLDVKGPELSSPEVWLPAAVAGLSALVTVLALAWTTSRQIRQAREATDKQIDIAEKNNAAQIDELREQSKLDREHAAREAHIERQTNARTQLLVEVIGCVARINKSTKDIATLKSEKETLALREPLDDLQIAVSKLSLWSPLATIAQLNEINTACKNYYHACEIAAGNSRLKLASFNAAQIRHDTAVAEWETARLKLQRQFHGDQMVGTSGIGAYTSVAEEKAASSNVKSTEIEANNEFNEYIQELRHYNKIRDADYKAIDRRLIELVAIARGDIGFEKDAKKFLSFYEPFSIEKTGVASTDAVGNFSSWAHSA